MAEELRWALIVISVFVIGGLLIHGLWSVRKKASAQLPQDTRVEPLQDGQDVAPGAQTHNPISAQREEPHLSELNFTADDSATQVNVEQAPNNNQSQTCSKEDDPVDKEASQQALADFIIVHIQMPDGLTMQGSKLLPAVNTLGFKYSEEGFFNRHLDPAGQGPVLFRLVNMYNPGTFDIDNMEQFSTAGVSLFMTLPCDGDGLAAFNMLHSAAKKIADEFDAHILDADRKEMTVERIRQYVEQVRVFSA